jgi:hypothetical protein
VVVFTVQEVFDDQTILKGQFVPQSTVHFANAFFQFFFEEFA